MKKAVEDKDAAEIRFLDASDPNFARYVEEYTDRCLPLVLGRAREIARELAMFGICSTQLVTEIDWKNMVRDPGAVSPPKLELIDPKRIYFDNSIPESARTSSDPK